MAVIIEVLGWGGKSQRHYRVEGPSITIGRGYQNDVVLSDSHICANHLRLDQVEGGWQLTDLGSINGIEVGKNVVSKASETLLAEGAEIKIGRTRLRIISDSHPVEPAKELHRLDRDASRLNRFTIWLPLLLTVLLIDVVTIYFTSYVEWQWKNALPSILFTQVFLLVLALFWAGVGRFLRDEANFLGHYNLILLATLFFGASNWMLDILGYNLSAEFLVSTVAPLCNLVLVAVLLAANFALATNMLARQRWITAASFAGLILVVIVANQMEEWGEFSPHPDYFSAVELPGLNISGAGSVDEFVADLERIFDRADRLAEKK